MVNKILPVHYEITLSNNEIVYESENIRSWRKLLDKCREENLKIKNFVIFYNDKKKNIRRNHSSYFFIIQDMVAAIKSGSARMKKGYGVVCNHPGGVERCYIDWFNTKNGQPLYPQIISRGKIPIFYKQIGVDAT